MQPISLYIHYPFCLAKCPYCDFNSYAISNFDCLKNIHSVDGAADENFLKAYEMELKFYHNLLGRRQIDTIFFGGGTPSLISSKQIENILNLVHKLFRVTSDAEISLEANPGTFENKKFQEFRSIGINRLSIGVQSLNDYYLKFFGRIHRRKEALEAIAVAQRYFQNSYSLDLIYARPEQTRKDWLEELKEVMELSPNHLSLYQLIIEEGTEFSRKKIKMPSEKYMVGLYEDSVEFLESKNINLYEVSNYARRGWECRHNLNYWNSGEWIAIGAGAHGRFCPDNVDICNYSNGNLGCEILKNGGKNNGSNGNSTHNKDAANNEYETQENKKAISTVDDYKIRVATENIKNPLRWQESVLKNGHGLAFCEKLTREEFIEEILLMGLRMRNGIALENVQKYLKVQDISELLNPNYSALLRKKYIEIFDNKLRVPLKYFPLLDSIVARLV